MRALLLAGVVTFGWAGAVLAAPYTLNRTIGAGSVTGSITTDGTIGTLATGNITAFDLVLNDGSGSIEITNVNAQVRISGTALSATVTGLFFDFGGPTLQYALFQYPNIGSSRDFYCLQTNACFNSLGGGEGVYLTGPLQSASRTGVVEIATAATAVPEPASLTLLGMGVAGIAAVRRRRAT